ncbi:MAG: DMT family transporter [Geminicoccaceae bacterium]|nr:DMT family transporter [Geminicoccaceae bacterium]MCX8101457.1 DMT family transporter [Geminicoccaceae bacterium]MDW8368701.1 DMT family transporter [Geminicoccaceae bacterium]
MDEGRRNLVVAIGLVTAGGFLFASMNAIVKALTARYPILMILWGRTFFHVAFVALFIPQAVAGAVRTRQLGIQLLRSVLLGASTVLNFTALLFLPLGDVAAITFLSPILVAALAVAILRERVGLVRWLAIATGFCGALLIVRPTGAGLGPGAWLALGCAAAYAVYQISTRMVREAEPLVSLLFSGLVGAVLFTLLLPWGWTTPTPLDLALMAATGLMGAAGHLMIILALRRGEASRVSPFNYLQLVWAMGASYLVFGDVPSPWTLAGAVVIVASGLWLYRLDLAELARRTASPAAARDR